MQEARFTVTLKASGDHDSPWIVARADTAGEMTQVLRDMHAEGMCTKVKQIADLFRGAAGGGTERALEMVRGAFPGSQAVSDAYGGYEPPREQQLPPSQSGPVCKQCNGPTEYKSGTSRSGKPYKGWFCRGNGDHTPQWV